MFAEHINDMLMNMSMSMPVHYTQREMQIRTDTHTYTHTPTHTRLLYRELSILCNVLWLSKDLFSRKDTVCSASKQKNK